MDAANCPYKPYNSFNYLDDAHTRGVDLKFPPNAHAIVTVGTDMPKDKLVQAIMRMRQIGRGQTVEFFGSEEVTRKMKTLTKKDVITSLEVLNWTLYNTIEVQEGQFIEFAKQGFTYEAKQMAIKLCHGTSDNIKSLIKICRDDEQLTLKSMYSGKLEKENCDMVIKQYLSFVYNHVHNILQEDHITLEDDVKSSIKASLLDVEYKINVKVGPIIEHRRMKRSYLDEEYERELEQQEEEEIQRELPEKQEPYHEEIWNIPTLLESDFLEKCPGVNKNDSSGSGYPLIYHITDAMKETSPLREHIESGYLQFSQKLFVTNNFMRSVKDYKVENGHYSKCIDVILKFEKKATTNSFDMSDYNFLLVSGQEANRILPLFWFPNEKSQHTVTYAHFPSLISSLTLPLQPAPFQLLTPIEKKVCFQMKLLMGETNFIKDKEMRKEFNSFFGVVSVTDIPQTIFSPYSIAIVRDLLKILVVDAIILGGSHIIVVKDINVHSKITNLADKKLLPDEIGVSHLIDYLKSLSSNRFFTHSKGHRGLFEQIASMRGKDFERSDAADLIDGVDTNDDNGED